MMKLLIAPAMILAHVSQFMSATGLGGPLLYFAMFGSAAMASMAALSCDDAKMARNMVISWLGAMVVGASSYFSLSISMMAGVIVVIVAAVWLFIVRTDITDGGF